MKFLAIFALALFSTGAIAEEKTSKLITVGEAIGIWDAISGPNSLSTHTTGVIDSAGQAVRVNSDFNYSGAVHLAFARDSAKAFVVYQEYQKQLIALRGRLIGDAKEIPKEKADEFNRQNAEMLAKSSGETFIHVNKADLCLDISKVPECPIKNNISVNILTALLPILDGIE